jgi:hypothetical protein
MKRLGCGKDGTLFKFWGTTWPQEAWVVSWKLKASSLRGFSQEYPISFGTNANQAETGTIDILRGQGKMERAHGNTETPNTHQSSIVKWDTEFFFWNTPRVANSWLKSIDGLTCQFCKQIVQGPIPIIEVTWNASEEPPRGERMPWSGHHPKHGVRIEQFHYLHACFWSIESWLVEPFKRDQNWYQFLCKKRGIIASLHTWSPPCPTTHCHDITI